jgi:ATP-dependent helicase HrpA
LNTFYDERLPDDAYTTGRLRSWLKRNPQVEASLRIERETLLARDPGGAVGEQFPDHLDWRDMQLALSYRFEPGKVADGVSVTVPVALLNRVPRFLFDWLVPGLLREKCIQLVKGLPKEKRKRLVPAPDFVDRALADLAPDDVDLLDALSRRLGRLGGVALARSDWAPEKLDDFYRMNVRVVDADGRLVAQGRDLGELVERFRSDTRETVRAAPVDSPAREGITRWDFEALPGEWRFRQAGMDIVAWPALVDRGDTVAIELCDYPGEAGIRHRLGVLRLLRLHTAQQVKYLRKQMLRGNAFNLVLAGAGLERGGLVEDLIDAAYLQAMCPSGDLPRSREAFLAALEAGRGEVVTRANELESILGTSLRALADARQKLAGMDAGVWPDSREDIDGQVRQLLHDGFLCDTPGDWLAQYPRYMKALLTRVERLPGQYPKDQKHTALLQALAQPLWDAAQLRPALLLLCPPAMHYRWMLEELRVSLFAQHLGTRVAVSEKRLQEQWQSVRQWLRENPH